MTLADVTTRSTSWSLAEGDEVVPLCRVQSLLGGGRSYEAYLAFDERLMTPVVWLLLRGSVAVSSQGRSKRARSQRCWWVSIIFIFYKIRLRWRRSAK